MSHAGGGYLRRGVKTMAESLARARVSVTGRVQGVWYRQSTAETAQAHNVSGWVRNLPGGGVEAALEGPRSGVESVIEFMSVGPPRADVRSIDVSWEAPAGEVGFSIRG